MADFPAFPTFQDRGLEFGAIIAGPSEDVRVIDFFGEAGIGKSRLLAEVAAELGKEQQSLVLQVDLAALPRPREGRPLAVLKQIADQMLLSGPVGTHPDESADKITEQLNTVGGARPVTLLVDTTEAVQDDPGFWQWFEKWVLSPLVSGGSTLVVLAGRLPAPIRLVEMRRHLKVWALQPLPVAHEARALVREVLGAVSRTELRPGDQQAAEQDTQLQEELTDVVLALSHGNPLLSQQIARYLADPANRQPADTLRRRVAEKVVGPFIDLHLFPFKTEMARWLPLMIWASVLDRFNATVFYRFEAALAGSQRAETEWQYDFVKAIAQLRAPYAVVRWEGEGYTLVGTVKSIVASYLQAARPDEYARALAAAAAVFNQIAEEYFTDNPQAGEPYRQASRSYQQRLDTEVQHVTTQ